jgi:hypothetical protein
MIFTMAIHCTFKTNNFRMNVHHDKPGDWEDEKRVIIC